ncbi:MAG: phage major capsid protein [Chlorobiaceae bacterium]|nr:phage major capsid protein [Chlorobiaceae bacterium]
MPKVSPDIDLEQFEAVRVKTGIQHRAAQVTATTGTDGEKQYEFYFSNEDPVEGRWIWLSDKEEYGYGTEILLHGAKNVDMSWIASGNAPFLKDHYTSQQAGVILGAELDTEKKALKVTGLKFSRSQMGKDLQADIDDGVRKNVSVGYLILEAVEIEPMDWRKGTPGVYHITRWRPMECSSVSIPAVESVGFDRNRKLDQDLPYETVIYRMKTHYQPERKGEGAMPPEDNNTNSRGGATPAPAEQPAPVNVNVTAGESESARISQVAALNRDIFPAGARLATEAIAAGHSFEQFREKYMPALKEAQEQLERQQQSESVDVTIGLTEREINKFRFVRLADYLANPTSRAAREAAAFELDVSDAAAKRANKSARGVLIPVDVLRGAFNPFNQRELTVAGDGQYFKQTNVLGGSFIDFLDAQSRVIQAGATVLRDLSGSVSIPRRDAEMVGGWIGESGDTGEKTPSYDAVTLSDKTYGMHVKISRQMRLQSSVDIEMLVRRDMATGMALGIDRGALAGTGLSNEPTGVINQTGVNTVTLAGAHAPTYGNIIDMETAISEDNALVDGASLAWILHPTLVGYCKKTSIETGDATKIISKDETGLIGYPRYPSTNAIYNSIKRMVLGNWSDLLIGFWSGLDVIVDPYSSSTDGTLKLVIFQDCDVALRHPESFCISVNPA